MDIREFRETLLRLDRPEDVLRLADRYLQTMEQHGDDFILPREHSIVEPALAYYAGDLEGWLKFIKGVRDRLPKFGRQFHPGVNAIYRTVGVRAVQVERRARIEAAVAAAVKRKLIPNDPKARQAYANRCTKVWMMQKKSLIKDASDKLSGRITVEEREDILKQFWKSVDEGIANGELPQP